MDARSDGVPRLLQVVLDTRHARALALGARLLRDRSDDPEEPLRVYADLAGHPFCIFVVTPAPGGEAADRGGPQGS